MRKGRKRYGMLRELKEKSPCSDCKTHYPYWVMQFDHRDSETKIMNISVMIERRSWSAILEEIAKCDLVCANCHATRTYLRSVGKTGEWCSGNTL